MPIGILVKPEGTTRITSTDSLKSIYSPIKAKAEGCRQSDIYGLSESPGNIQETAVKYDTGKGEKGVANRW
jgi:hypothetical protein